MATPPTPAVVHLAPKTPPFPSPATLPLFSSPLVTLPSNHSTHPSPSEMLFARGNTPTSPHPPRPPPTGPSPRSLACRLWPPPANSCAVLQSRPPSWYASLSRLDGQVHQLQQPGDLPSSHHAVLTGPLRPPSILCPSRRFPAPSVPSSPAFSCLLHRPPSTSHDAPLHLTHPPPFPPPSPPLRSFPAPSPLLLTPSPLPPPAPPPGPREGGP